MSRFLLATGLLLVIAGSGCAVSVDDGQVSFVDDDAQLFCAEGPALALAAQAVPTADHIPCVDELPAGWSVDRTDFDSEGVMMALDSRRAPIDDLRFDFTETCEPTGALVDPEDQTFPTPPGATTHQDVELDGDDLYIRVVVTGPGYCGEFNAPLEASEAVGRDDFPSFVWVPRDLIADGLLDTTDERLRLDP